MYRFRLHIIHTCRPLLGSFFDHKYTFPVGLVGEVVYLLNGSPLGLHHYTLFRIIIVVKI